MKSIYTWVVILLLILIGGYWYISGGSGAPKSEAILGEYEYLCDNGSEFSMTPSDDVTTVRIVPGAGADFEEMTLQAEDSDAGARYVGGGVVFVGAGEGVQFTVADKMLMCNPKPNPDEAPWNWGDAGEGGGVKPDVMLVVGESIVGKWQSVTDPYVREFKADGVVTDIYDGKEMSQGTWMLFTKEKPLSVSFPLQNDTVYIQLTVGDMPGDTINFKLNKLTPEELELTYMDRGGVLKFTYVK